MCSVFPRATLIDFVIHCISGNTAQKIIYTIVIIMVFCHFVAPLNVFCSMAYAYALLCVAFKTIYIYFDITGLFINLA